jgi:serine protease Do
MRVIRGTVPLVMCLVLVPYARADDPDSDRVLKAFEKKLTETIEAASPSIACVVVSRSEFYPKGPADETPGKLGDFDRDAFLKKDKSPDRVKLANQLALSDPKTIPDHGFAGGVVIDKAGYVLTPYHVIDGAKKVYVFLPDGPRSFSGSYADIHAADARSDLAVLKLQTPPPKLKPIKFADVRTFPPQQANVKRGTLIVLMANPHASEFRMGQPSAAWGTITNVRTRIAEPERQGRLATPRVRYTEFGTLLEYDVKRNAGVTGGVLLNLDGEMIGMTNAAALAWGKEIGAGYAVPIDGNYRRIIEVLRRGEEVDYGFIGVQTSGGQALMIEPIAGGAAARAGIGSRETIVKINGVAVESFDDLQLQIGSALAGSKIKVTVLPQMGRAREVEVTLGKLRNDQPFVASVRPEPVFGLRVDYPTVLGQQKQASVPPGVSVRDLVADSPAAKRFKDLGDAPERWFVTHVNGVEVTTPAEFYKAARGKESVKLTLFDTKDDTTRDLKLP